MIPYTPLTAQDVIEEVVARMNKLRSGTNVDWTTLLTYLNYAIKETIAKTAAYKSWAYMATLQLPQAQTILPNNVLGVKRVMVSANGQPPFVEARRIDMKEFFTLTSSPKAISWTRDINLSPVYTLWGGTANTPTVFMLYIQPTTHTGFADVLFAPPDLTAPNNIVPIPYEFRNLVILGTLTRALAKYKDKELMKQLLIETKQANEEVIDKFISLKSKEIREKATYQEPLIQTFNPEANALK